VGIGRALKRQTLTTQLNTLLDGPSASNALRTGDPQLVPSGQDVEMETDDAWVDEPPLPPVS
jgi:hypothetical protein